MRFNSPGKYLPVITLRIILNPDFLCNKPQKMQWEHELKITKASELICHRLTDHTFHPLALYKKQLFGKKVPLHISPDHSHKVIEKIFSSVGGVEIKHRNVNL